MQKRGQSKSLLIGTLVLAVAALSFVLLGQFASVGAMTAEYVDHLQGTISDNAGNSLGYGPLYALSKDGKVVGSGYTSIETYTLDLKNGWDDDRYIWLELGNKKSDVMRCVQLNVDDMLARKTVSGITVDVTCNVVCERKPDMFHCIPDDSTGTVLFNR